MMQDSNDLPQRLNEFIETHRELKLSPFDFAEQVEPILVSIVSADGEGDPNRGDDARQLGERGYQTIINGLLGNNLHAVAAAILQRWWELLARRQRTEQRHFIRAIASHWLSEVELQAGNFGTAFRWSLLAHADDILSSHSEGGGGALDSLVAQFGVSRNAIDTLTKIATKCRDAAENSEGWASSAGFPEEAVRQFSERNADYVQQISNLRQTAPFPLCRPYLQALLEKVNAASTDSLGQPISTTERGRRLQDLSTYLLGLLPGCISAPTYHDLDGAFETDIVVRNLYSTPNVWSDLFGRYILVECKNWKDRVSVQHVGYFLFRMRIAHAKLGVIFARNGITGTAQGSKNARALIRRSFHEDGSICVVLDQCHIQSMIDGDEDFWPLLLRESEALPFGRRK